MATIRDIAQYCGTSVTTVSYVLNGKGDQNNISRATQEKVLAAAETLHYRPNMSAKRLHKAKDSLSITLFWPDYSFEQGIRSVLRALKNTLAIISDAFEINLQFYEPGHLSEKESLFSGQEHNGSILAGAAESDLAYLAGHKPPLPVVLMNRTLEGFPFSTIDHAAAGKMAADMAIEAGGDSICALWERKHHVATNIRRVAFLERCETCGIDLTDRQFFCDETEESGYAQGIRMIQKKTLANVIFCNHEGIARGLLCALSESGITVGQDLLLFTANVAPDSFCRYCTPSLTAIDLKMQTVAEQALKMCIALASHQALSASEVIFQPEAVFRDSFPAKTL